MSTLLSAIIFIVTSGGLFTNRFKNRPTLRMLAACVAIVSAVYLIAAISEDVRAYMNRNSAFTPADETISTPASKPIPTSNFDYSVIDKGNEIDFVFPGAALEELALLSDDGELGSTGFSVKISEKLSIGCTHWISQGASSYNYGYKSYEDLLPELQCSAWSLDQYGSGSLINDVSVKMKFASDNASAIMTLEDPGVFRLARIDNSDPCEFRVQNSALQFVKRQHVKC